MSSPPPPESWPWTDDRSAASRRPAAAQTLRSERAPSDTSGPCRSPGRRPACLLAGAVLRPGGGRRRRTVGSPALRRSRRPRRGPVRRAVRRVLDRVDLLHALRRRGRRTHADPHTAARHGLSDRHGRGRPRRAGGRPGKDVRRRLRRGPSPRRPRPGPAPPEGAGLAGRPLHRGSRAVDRLHLGRGGHAPVAVGRGPGDRPRPGDHHSPHPRTSERSKPPASAPSPGRRRRACGRAALAPGRRGRPRAGRPRGSRRPTRGGAAARPCP